MNETTPTSKLITVIGRMGGDPEAKRFEAQPVTKLVYDPVIDGEKEVTFNSDEVNFLTFSVACGGYNDVPLRWINCVDWDGLAFRARKGDKVVLLGYWENRPYVDKNTGEDKVWRQFVVKGFQIRSMKVRDRAA